MIEVRTPAAPVETVTPIKPSEALRLGILLAPVQAFGAYVAVDGSACAIGAMSLAWGVGPATAQGRLEEVGGWDETNAPPPCPQCGIDGFGWPPHLNDDHRWSRERIADWLEGLGL